MSMASLNEESIGKHYYLVLTKQTAILNLKEVSVDREFAVYRGDSIDHAAAQSCGQVFCLLS
jgi:hypothetical protein